MTDNPYHFDPKTMGAVRQPEGNKADISTYMQLREVLAREHVALVVAAILRVYALAIERKCGQSITLNFNERGYLRGIEASDNVRIQVPKAYQEGT